MISRYATAKKAHARQDTIVDLYRAVFGRMALPVNKQYWSMCATCVDAQGQPLPGSELAQMIEVSLIQPHQFHGVDRDEDVYKINSKNTEAHWYCDDFYDCLSAAADQPAFNPGIVNVDTIHEPERGVVLFCNVLERLREFTDVLFVGNFILKNRTRKYTVDDVVERLMRNPGWREVASTLQWDERFYWYNGATAYGLTEMCSVLMWRK